MHGLQKDIKLILISDNHFYTFAVINKDSKSSQMYENGIIKNLYQDDVEIGGPEN